MKFRPILYQTEMVQAIEAGTKSMTRRTKGLEKLTNHYFQSLVHHATGKFTFVENGNYSPKESDVIAINCPFGQVGDILWVRETFLWVMLDHAPDLLEGSRCFTQYVYKASVHDDWFEYAKEKYSYKWTPSLFMPKNACRTFLRITDISVERLQDISIDDARAEGIRKEPFGKSHFKNYVDGTTTYNERLSFYSLWESINGKESLAANPFVWVIKFERVQCRYNYEINNFELIE